MATIFRIYSGGSNTLQGWSPVAGFPYGSTARGTIEDPEGASAENEITSIPSPFARIDLVKAAFREVNKSGDPDGNTIYHKMVSDTLDVAEIFFNLGKYRDKIELIQWDPAQKLDELKNSGYPGHKYLATALEKYMRADAKTYNFSVGQSLYLLNYKNGPKEINIIGATSPATLFFSNANDLSYVNDVFFGDDVPFDKEYQPLYKRDFELVKYFFALRNTMPGFAAMFPEVDEYLSGTFERITDIQKKDELRNADALFFGTLDGLQITTDTQAHVVEVHNQPLYMKAGLSAEDMVSEFTICSDIYEGVRPLVLPVTKGNKYQDLIFTSGRWGRENAAPFIVSQSDLSHRVLPFDGSVYPWLSISDFLEDTMVSVAHTLNSASFFDGNLKEGKDKMAYLLPLKPLFFRFFTVEQLTGVMEDGRRMIEMERLAGDSVRVKLRIPVTGNSQIRYIEYERTYFNNNSPELYLNKGGMKEFDFSGVIMPPVKFTDATAAIYNATCIHGRSTPYFLSFYQGDTELEPTSVMTRQNSGESIVADNYLLEKKLFDYISINDRNGVKGILIPLLKAQTDTQRFEFTIDLGTSNTHIEYRAGSSGRSKVFAIDEAEAHICEFFSLPSIFKHDQEIIEKDILPRTVGESDFRFPTRTVLASGCQTDWALTVNPFMEVNLPFTYDKRTTLSHDSVKDNIKWGKGKELSHIEAYVRCLMLLLRNKVVINGGRLSDTRIIWFYPISMPRRRRQSLRATWDKAFTEYFGSGSTVSMSESAAPIHYLFNAINATTRLVNIDIGGGTTDVAFANDRVITHVTSFRFASNTLFQDAFAQDNYNNGIVDHFKGQFADILHAASLDELERVYNSDSNQKPANMASFLFGLVDNVLVKARNLDPKTVDFNGILREDEHFKIVFIIFYSAIVYHVAQMVKALDLGLPRHLSFSGNGSKVLRAITGDMGILADYTKRIFSWVGMPYSPDMKLEILGLDTKDHPKESTCKGGFYANGADEPNIGTILLKTDGSGIIDKKGNIKKEDTYAGVTDDYRRQCVENVRKFFDLVTDTANVRFLRENFDVTTASISLAKEVVMGDDLSTFLNKGIAQCLGESQPDDVIEETFFFYPIKGVLTNLSQAIRDSL